MWRILEFVLRVIKEIGIENMIIIVLCLAIIFVCDVIQFERKHRRRMKEISKRVCDMKEISKGRYFD